MHSMGRRTALRLLGGAGALVAGCSDGSGQSPGTNEPPSSPPGNPPGPLPPPPPPPETPPGPSVTPQQLLADVDTIVVVMMENRSFDHYLGSLKKDTKYPSGGKVDGLDRSEQNLAPNGTPVQVFNLTDF